MSKLEELIARLCPDGVEYKPIKETYKRLKGTPITAAKMKEIQNPKGNIRIFAGGKTIIDAMEDDIPNANITRVPAVLVQSRGIIDAVYYDKPFTFKNEMWAYTSDTVTETKFLYYVLKNNIQTFRDAASGMGSLPQISLKVTEEFKVPVPPLEVQREIVKELDIFVEYGNLLKRELEVRKKQLEGCKQNLLSSSKQEGNSTTLKSLDECCELQKGVTPIQKAVPGDYPLVVTTVERRTANNYQFDCKAVCVPLVSSRGHGVASLNQVYYQEGKFALGNILACVAPIPSSNLNAKFLYYYLNYMKDLLIVPLMKGGANVSLTIDSLKRIKIPVPPLSEQQRIVDILDRFDALCNDITSGLPAEIEARRKQYEYYRDKLLTFKELKKEA